MGPLGGGGKVLTPMFKKINFGRAALLIDDHRHEIEINFGSAASRPRSHVAFSDKPNKGKDGWIYESEKYKIKDSVSKAYFFMASSTFL